MAINPVCFIMCADVIVSDPWGTFLWLFHMFPFKRVNKHYSLLRAYTQDYEAKLHEGNFLEDFELSVSFQVPLR